ncbi:MAG TPA: hypothetical protein VE891_10695 [Allosphingosinicella sp.]|nr:hypothetical protein [Allosphingosinicella sp.]
MGESQVPYPNLPSQVSAIRGSLSEPRFSTYLRKGGGDEGYALALYLYNTRVAKAFWYPLGVVEVTLRNAIDALLVARFGPTWHLEPSFRDTTLTPQGLTNLNKAIDRAGQGASRSQVIAELTFDYWSNLFRPDYAPLWRTSLNIVFPNISGGTTRHDVQTMARSINTFRNRVAHHEPVLDLNVTDVHAKIVELVSLRCRETAAWLKHHSTLSAVIRSRPHGAQAAYVTLGSKLAPGFVAVTKSTPLDAVIGQLDRKNQAVVCLDSGGAPEAVFGAMEIIKFLSGESKANAGLVAPSECTVEALLNSVDVSKSWIAMDESEPLAMAIDRLKEAPINAILGLTATGTVAGSILRAHRRY